jgi:phosphoribosyl-AMP cyclohydrolase / phosphoribosyl-ATP pyrophosphohydrolase
VLESGDIKFDGDGLVPCIVQDWASGEVLTLAYMSAEALTLTQQTGEMHFWSRSRQELWHKGATSGNTQALKALRYDCDGDAILALVEPHGPACHTGERSCFYRGEPVPGSGEPGGLAVHEVLPDLERTIEARRHNSEDGKSYTAALLRDPEMARAKVLEEAEEVTRATSEESDARVANEAADLLYHLTALLATRELSLTAALTVLDERRGAARRYQPSEQR